MKAMWITAIVILAACLMVAMRSGDGFPLPKALPFLGGAGRPPLYDYGALALVVITIWGMARLRRRDSND